MPTDAAHPLPPTRDLPPDNTPGHHPEVEQDQPSPERLRKAWTHTTTPRTFAFAFDPLYRWTGRALGIRPESTKVEVTDEEVVIHFGRWSSRIDRSTITSVEVTGPYAIAKTLGPPHLSFADRGITFATNRQRGVCLQLSRTVKGIDPLGLIRHPGVTVTVEDPDRFAELLVAPPT